LLLITGLVLIVGGIAAWVAVPRIYRALDAGYQKAMDPVRINDAKTIAALILEYADKTGSFPFQEHAAERPFMVLIGHSQQEEDSFAKEKVLARNAMFANASMLEGELGRELGRPVVLPRDPQKVATYAPNVYIYFVADGQMSVIAHLFQPSDRSVKYEWRDGVFYSHTLTYASKKRE
jgi:hypothetical protein